MSLKNFYRVRNNLFTQDKTCAWDAYLLGLLATNLDIFTEMIFVRFIFSILWEDLKMRGQRSPELTVIIEGKSYKTSKYLNWFLLCIIHYLINYSAVLLSYLTCTAYLYYNGVHFHKAYLPLYYTLWIKGGLLDVKQTLINVINSLKHLSCWVHFKTI